MTDSNTEPVPAPEECDVVVIGGGVAGLVAALENARVGLRVTVLETTNAPGGCLARHLVGGIALDAGAESFATRKNLVADYLGGLGLAESIVAPNPAGSWLRLPSGASIPMPKASVLGIPSSPLADDVRSAIGWQGAIRAYADRLMPVLKIGKEENLGELVRKRMGQAVLDTLVAPVAGGVYSADPMQLSVEAVAPGLNAALTRTGSLSGAVAQLSASAPAGSRVAGIEGGMARLVDSLVAELTKLGGRVLLGVRAESIERVSGAALTEPSEQTEKHCEWRILATRRHGATVPAGDTAAGTLAAAAGLEPDTEIEIDTETVELRALGLVLAAPSAESLRLLATALPTVPAWAELERLDWPDAPGVELVTLLVTAPELDRAPRGTGVLTSAADPSVRAKALTHVSAKWAWVGEAATAGGAGRHVLRLSYGRAGAPNPLAGLGDESALRVALADASAILGTELSTESVVDMVRTSWGNALPVATLGAERRIREVRAALTAQAGIEVTGAWLAGTGLAQVIPDAREAGRRLRHGLVGTA